MVEATVRPIFTVPSSGPNTTTVEIDRDPATRSANNAGWGILNTYTFNPADLRNERYQILDLTFNCTITGTNGNDDDMKIVVTQGGVATDQGFRKGENAVELALSWNVRVTDYTQALEVTINAVSNSILREGNLFVVTANVIPHR